MDPFEKILQRGRIATPVADTVDPFEKVLQRSRERPVEENGGGAPELSFDREAPNSLYNNRQVADTVRRFYQRRDNKVFDTDEEAIDYFVGDRTWKQSNSLHAMDEFVYSITPDVDDDERDERLKDLAFLMKTWDNLPNLFEEGGRGFSGLASNLIRGAADPFNLVSGGLASRGMGRVASIATGLGVDAAVSGVADAATQGSEIQAGVRKEFDPTQTGMSMAVGAGASAAGSIVATGAGRLLRTLPESPVDAAIDALDPAERTAAQLGASRTVGLGEENKITRPFKLYHRATNDELPGYSFASESEAHAFMRNLSPSVSANLVVKDTDRIYENPIRRWMNTGLNTFVDSLTRVEQISNLAQTSVARGVRMGALPRHVQALNAYQFARIAENAPIIARMWTQGGGQIGFNRDTGFYAYTDADGNVMPSLSDILKPLGQVSPKFTHDFGKYFFYKRLLDIDAMERRVTPLGRGNTIGINRNEMEAFVKAVEQNLDPESFQLVSRASMQLQKYNDNFVDFMEATGYIDRKTAQNITYSNLFYLPIHRIIEDDPNVGKASTTVNKNVRGVKAGTVSHFVDPLAQYQKNVEVSVLKAVENMRIRKLVDTIEAMPEGLRKGIGGYVPKENHSHIFSKKNVQDALSRALQQNGVPQDQARAYVNALNNTTLDFLQLWWKDHNLKGSGRKGTSTQGFLKDGEFRVYEFKDPLLAASVDYFAEGSKTRLFDNNWGAGLQAFVSGLQYTITRDPEFVLGTSLPTDSVTGFVYSPNWANLPGLNTALGAAQMRMNQKDVVEAIANGALMGGPLSESRNHLMREFLERKGIRTDNIMGLSADQDKAIWQRIARRMVHDIEGGALPFDMLAQTVESAPRFFEYMRLKNQGLTNAQAGFQAIENNINFRARGTSVRWNQYLSLLPFMNATKNVLHRQGKLMNLKREGNASRISKQLAVTGAIAALAFINKDNPDYQELNELDRTMFWHLWPNGEHIKIRKPDDIAVWGNAIEEFIYRINTFGEDPGKAMWDAARFAGSKYIGSFRGATAGETIARIAPYPTNLIVQDLLNVRVGGQIVPKDLQYYFEDAPEQQFYEGQTPVPAIELGKALGVSPLRIEHYIRGTMGPFAKYWFAGQNALDPDRRPRMDRDDIPVFRRFTESPKVSGNTGFSEEFYKLFDQSRKRKGVFSGLSKFLRVDDLQRNINEATEDEQKLFALYQMFDRINRDISDIRKSMKQREALGGDPVKLEEQKQRDLQSILELQKVAVITYYTRNGNDPEGNSQSQSGQSPRQRYSLERTGGNR